VFCAVDDDGLMKVYDPSSSSHVSMKVSKLIYAMQTDIERVSRDRLQRFHHKQFEELTSAKMNVNVPWEKRNNVSLGDFVVIKSPVNVLFGRIIKFRYPNDGKKKSSHFPFNVYFFELNKPSEFFFYPSYIINQENGNFQEINCRKWYSKTEYVVTLNENSIDFVDKIFHNIDFFAQI
jgi:hypothetical protein